MLRTSAEIREKDNSSWANHVSYLSENRTCYRTVISAPGTFLRRDSRDQPFSRFPHRLSSFCFLSAMSDINFYYCLRASMIAANWLISDIPLPLAHKLLYLRAFARAHIADTLSWWLFRVPCSFKSDNFSPLYNFNILTLPTTGDLVLCTGWFYTPW